MTDRFGAQGAAPGSSDAAAAPATYSRVRAAFAYFDPALANPAFMENAGGSQVPRCVADAVHHHLLYDCAQLDAGHPVSVRSTSAVAAAHDTMAAFMGAPSAGAGGPGSGGHVALGPSTSQLLASLGACYARLLGPADEIVVQEACHEANIGPWERCAEACGAKLRWWRIDTTPSFSPAPAKGAASEESGDGLPPLRASFPCASPLSQLRGLLSDRTRIVAVTHVSNLIGAAVDLPRLVALVREATPRARIVVDGVAYAPHRAMDVAAWGVDWYGLSIYKTWGPHAAALYGSGPAFAELTAGMPLRGPNHYFVPASNPPYWFELGGISHEAAAGVAAVGQYLRLLAGTAAADGNPSAGEKGYQAGGSSGGRGGGGASTGAGAAAPGVPLQRSEVVAAFRTAAALEAPLAGPILDFLASHPRALLIGPGGLREPRGSGGKAGHRNSAAAAGDSGGASDGEEDAGWAERMPTISFVHTSKPSSVVAQEVQERGFAIRSGHAYAHRLMTALAPVLAPYLTRGQPAPSAPAVAGGAAAGGPAGGAAAGAAALADLVADGVVRISLLHYNTPSEVEGLVAALREVL